MPPTTVAPETLDALQRLESLAIDTDTKAAPDPKKLCETYAKMAPSLKKIAPLLALVPTYGPGISAAISVLVGIANSLCPSTTETPQP
jgi:hypothetical protein